MENDNNEEGQRNQHKTERKTKRQTIKNQINKGTSERKELKIKVIKKNCNNQRNQQICKYEERNQRHGKEKR
jgi:hypothetical protein